MPSHLFDDLLIGSHQLLSLNGVQKITSIPLTGNLKLKKPQDGRSKRVAGFIFFCEIHPDPWGNPIQFEEQIFEMGGKKPPPRKMAPLNW